MDRTRPRIARLSVGRLRAGGAATVRFTLSERATVRFVLRRRVGDGNPARSKIVATIHRHGAAGRNRIRLDGRIGGRALPVGRYRLTAVAHDPAGNRSRAIGADLRVLPVVARFSAG